jgi:serine/threonine-protein kinase RsbT
MGGGAAARLEQLKVSPLAARVLATLESYVSAIHARSMFQRALAGAGLDASALDARTLQTILPALERSVRLFVDGDALTRLVPALWALAGGLASSGANGAASAQIAILTEDDVSRARLAARSICHEAGAPSLAAQKIATAVSELARNILKYAGVGTIDIELAAGERLCLVRATDNGPGIERLDEILSGRYRSKTGMGLGLLGTRRLSDRFDIRSGAGGTIVTVEVKL